MCEHNDLLLLKIFVDWVLLYGCHLFNKMEDPSISV